MNQHGASPPSDEELLERAMPTLRRLADDLLARDRVDHTLQPTALVHELYLKLMRQRGFEGLDEDRLLAIARRAMQQILIDYARGRSAEKRGGGRSREADSAAAAVAHRDQGDLPERLRAAVDRLREHHPRAAEVARLRIFEPVTLTEIAERIGAALRTVQKDWRFAWSWLERELELRPR